ncbi:unnamed protein product [Paramecium primaurelia]|uniref:Thioredoxin-like protein n=1 Tax=Paramecium primaurelia TaxID=5886 RepID=A0A8S1K304_PARPR|nr:unnamed protein product [Paramecium primaurelia]
MITGNLFRKVYLLRFRFSTSYAELIASNKANRVQDVGSLKELLDQIYQTKPYLHCIIFNQVGHPYYQQVNEMYNEISNQFIGFKFYRINVDNLDKAAQFFGVKNIPASLIYGQGSPLAKHIGLGKKILQNKLETSQSLTHNTEFIPGTEQWEGPQDLWKANYEDDQEPFDYFAR